MGRLREKFKIMKMIGKGIEGAVIAGGGAEAIMQIADADVENKDHFIMVVATALTGFALKALKNWLKNR